MRTGILSLLFAATAALSCTSGSPSTETEAVASKAAALGSSQPLIALAVQQGKAHAIHGVENTRYNTRVFMLQPESAPSSPAGVYVASGLTGEDFGSLPAPPGGFKVPLSARVLSQDASGYAGRLVVLDNQGTPAEAGTLTPKLFFYNFSGGLHSFSATYDSEVTLPSAAMGGFVYPGSLVLLGGGKLGITDNVGAIWTIGTDGTGLAPAYVNLNFSFGAVAPFSTIGVVGDASGSSLGTVMAVTMQLPAPPGAPLPPGVGLGPGIHSIGYSDSAVGGTDDVCFSVTTGGNGLDPSDPMNPLGLPYQGVHCIAKSVLLAAGPPVGKPLTRSFHGVEALKLVDAVDVHGRWLFAARAATRADGKQCVVRMDLTASDPLATLEDVTCTPYAGTEGLAYDGSSLHQLSVVRQSWANEIRVSELVPGLLQIAVSIGQEYNNPAVNAALSGVPKYYGPRVFAAAFALE